MKKSYLLVQHKLPHTLATIVYDCLYSEHSRSVFAQTQYLLQVDSKEAQVYFFNDQLTNNTYNLKIKHLKDPKCFVFSHKQLHYKILAYFNSAITIYGAHVGKLGNFQQDFRAYNFPIKLQKNEEITYISSPIQLANQEVYIAYTSKDNFYLISTHFQKGEYLLDCVKLLDLDEPKGIMNWFSKGEKQHYNSIGLQLIGFSAGEQAIRVVSVRDYEMMIHFVDIKPQIRNSTIKVILKVNQLSSIISNKCTLDDIVILKNQVQDIHQPQKDHVLNFIAIFNDKQKKYLVDIQVFLSQTQIQPYLNLIHSFDISFYFSLTNHLNTYFFSWFSATKDKYCLSFFNEEEILKLNEQVLQELKPCLEQDAELFFCKGDKKMFILTDSSVHKFETLQDNELQAAFYLKKLPDFNQKIYKAVQVRNYEEISEILRQMAENYKQVGNTSNDHLEQQLCIFILRIVLNSQYLQELQQQLELSVARKEKSQNILSQACQQIDLWHLKNLVDFIAGSQLFNPLVVEIITEASKEFCQNSSVPQSNQSIIFLEYLNQLFGDAIRNVLKTLAAGLQSNKEMLEPYQLLITSLVYFKQIQVEMLQPLLSIENFTFIKDFIIKNKKADLFIHFFTKTSLQFFTQDAKLFCQALKAEKGIDIFVFIKNLVQALRQEFRVIQGEEVKQQDLWALRQKINVLIHGFSTYSQHILANFQQTFPGLAVYYYLKDRKNSKEKLRELAKRCTDSQTSYILNLASGKSDTRRNSNRLSDDQI